MDDDQYVSIFDVIQRMYYTIKYKMMEPISAARCILIHEDVYFARPINKDKMLLHEYTKHKSNLSRVVIYDYE
jgi:hypothetical protein